MAGAMVYSDRGGWLISGQIANGTGSGLDCRGAINFGILEVRSTGNSALFDLLYSPNGTDWATALSVTATNGATSMFQISAFYPFVAGGARGIFSAAGGSATAYAFYRPGISV